MRPSTGATNAPWFREPCPEAPWQNIFPLEVVSAAWTAGQHDNVGTIAVHADMQRHIVACPNGQFLHSADASD